ncbi:hypothetical protein DevBK_02550 [Devosia sp. BK]|jgi:hypothetical protein|uniref:hypothetical protein n=1 Tax=unclassified Devosia TaxID=196773 RepID=UPI000714AAE8|nr:MULTISPECIES: hypothetical protein [unclassified Devosia]KQN69954.1 hypothetical protein ASE94_12760 [Devosia sp. Leaf64]MDV3250207.1 hypothetical protein [Devosia sp. BK]
MQTTPSRGRKSLKIKVAIASGFAVALGLSGALLAGVTPALAADLAAQPDAQVAVFMVPLTILVLTMMFEVSRYVWRNRIPASVPPRRRVTNWSAPKQR